MHTHPAPLSPRQVLLSLGPSAQEAIYGAWFAASCDRMPPDVRSALDSVRKLDPSNAAQAVVLAQCYRFNMHTIDFWLNSCVFPLETVQFPHCIMATAWHASDSPEGRLVGFSGTKDSELLLPLLVRQDEPDVQELRATDGLMLQLILQNATHLALDSRVENDCTAHVDIVLDAVCCIAAEQRCADAAVRVSALIDAGGLMAGSSNIEVCRFVRMGRGPQRRRAKTVPRSRSCPEAQGGEGGGGPCGCSLSPSPCGEPAARTANLPATV